jgi:hypothetical protein
MATDDSSGLWYRLKRWLGVAVETVPADIAACEYDCRRTLCDAEALDQCERRQRAAAAEAEAGANPTSARSGPPSRAADAHHDERPAAIN